MVSEICIPRVNANEDKVLLAQILVKQGEQVFANSEVAIIETTKATHSIESASDGWVSMIHSFEGEMVTVGSILMTVTSDKEIEIPKNVNGELEGALDVPGTRQTAKDRLRLMAKKKNSITIVNTKKNFPPLDKLSPSGELLWVIEARRQLDSENSCMLKRSDAELRRLFPNVEIGDGVTIRAERICIGKNTIIGAGTVIDVNDAFIGDGVALGKNCEIITGELIISDGVTMGDDVLVDLAGGRSFESRLLVGGASLIGGRAIINTSREVVFEEKAALSPGGMIFTHSYWQSALSGYSCRFEPVRLASNAWVGAACQVLPGVIIGSGSVVVSNSTVVENVPSNAMVAGVPAAIIRHNLERKTNTEDQKIELLNYLEGFWTLLRDRKCMVEVTGLSIQITMPNNLMRHVVVLGAKDHSHKIPADAIILSFGPAPLNAYATFDLLKNVFYGGEDPLVHTLRNFLRRLGIRFAPYSWRPDFKKEI